MKIAYDAKRLFNNFTGLGNYSRNVVTGLIRGYPENEYRLYTPKIVDCAATRPILKSGCCHPVLPDGIVKGSLWRTFGQPAQMKREGIQLFHGLSHEIPVGLSRARIPSVVTMHDVAYRTFTDMYTLADRVLYDTKYGYACRHATRVVAISQSTKADVMRFYGVPEEKVQVVCQPVNELFYQPMEVSEARRVADGALKGLPGNFCLYVGTVNSRKNLLGVVKAIHSLPSERRPFLVAVGQGGEYLDRVKAFVSANGMDAAVRFESGIRDGRVLQALYRLADAFIYPSFYEGFGLPVVEASLQGCPVVTSNVTSLPEAAGPDAVLVDPASTESIAQGISSLLDDPEKRLKAGKAGEAYARKNFDPARQAKKMMDLYLSLVS